MRTPKQRFLESSYSGQWGKIASSETFEEALHAAFTQLQFEMPIECAQPQQACDAHQQMVGARKLMDILCSLHTPQTTTKTVQSKGLDYSVGV